MSERVMEDEMKPRKMCTFCQSPSNHYIRVKPEGMQTAAVMCENCISRDHKGDKLAAEEWIEKTFAKK